MPKHYNPKLTWDTYEGEIALEKEEKPLSLAQEASYIIYIGRDGYVKAKNCRTGHVESSKSTDATTVIQNAINATSDVGGRILFKPGVYNVRTLTGKTNVVLEGEYRGDIWSFDKGAVLKYVGDSGGPVLDFRNVSYWFGVKNIKIDGNNKLAGYGILMGTQDEGLKQKFLLLDGITIQQCDVGVQFYVPGWAGKTDDTEMTNFIIRFCNTGIDYTFTNMAFRYGAIGQCGVGFKQHSPGSTKFDHVAFTNNTVDVQYADDGWVNAVEFNFCWFENSSQAILNRPSIQAGVSKEVADITFLDCFLYTLSTSVLLDFRNMIVDVHLIGGDIHTAPGSKLIQFDTVDAGSRIEVRGVNHSHLLSFSGLYSGFRSTTIYFIKIPAGVTGYAGTTYSNVSNTLEYLDVEPTQVVKAEVVYVWDPGTDSGGIRLNNRTKAVTFGTVEPGVAGARVDRVDVTSSVRVFDPNDDIIVQTKGDGTTTPTIWIAKLVLWW